MSGFACRGLLEYGEFRPLPFPVNSGLGTGRLFLPRVRAWNDNGPGGRYA